MVLVDFFAFLVTASPSSSSHVSRRFLEIGILLNQHVNAKLGFESDQIRVVGLSIAFEGFRGSQRVLACGGRCSRYFSPYYLSPLN